MSTKKNSLNEKLDTILENQKKILKNEAKIFKEEEKLESIENEGLQSDKNLANSEKEALKELENLEKEFSKTTSPISQITKKDFMKGFIGAFIGVMSHFAFSKAADLAPTLEIWRATILYILAFIIIIGMLYYTGFRKVRKQTILRFMPARATILYGVSIITILIVNALFGKISFPINFTEIYTIVGANIMLAVMGAGTADLIGRAEND